MLKPQQNLFRNEQSLNGIWDFKIDSKNVGLNEKWNLEFSEERDYIVGLHAWVFADFRTTHSTMRIGGLNHKGAFTRDRKPKMSAHYLRSKWNKKSIEK